MWKELLEQGSSFCKVGPMFTWKVKDSEGRMYRIKEHEGQFSPEDRDLFAKLYKQELRNYVGSTTGVVEK